MRYHQFPTVGGEEVEAEPSVDCKKAFDHGTFLITEITQIKKHLMMNKNNKQPSMNESCFMHGLKTGLPMISRIARIATIFSGLTVRENRREDEGDGAQAE